MGRSLGQPVGKSASRKTLINVRGLSRFCSARELDIMLMTVNVEQEPEDEQHWKFRSEPYQNSKSEIRFMESLRRVVGPPTGLKRQTDVWNSLKKVRESQVGDCSEQVL